MQIKEGYRKLNIGEVIQEGDLFSQEQTVSWRNCESSIGQPYKETMRGFKHDDITVIRKISEPKFKVGDEVSLLETSYILKLLNKKSLSGSIVSVIGKALQGEGNRYEIQLYVENLPITVVLRDEFIQKVEKIAGHNVAVKEGGLQIGCTFVSDEDIRKAAELRNII